MDISAGFALRDYQSVAVNNVIESVNRGNKPILAAPTGSGKTVMGAAFVRAANGKTLWLAHRIELIHQAADKLRSCGLHVGLIIPGVKVDPHAVVHVGSIQTAVRRDLIEPRIIVIDECHHATSGSYLNIFSRFPHASRIGLTATPYRLDGTGLSDVFDQIITAASPRDLVEAKHLVAPRVYAPEVINTKGIASARGDYVSSQLAIAVDKPRLVANIVEQWMRHAAGRKTIVFAVNIKHSLHIVNEFAQAGIAAEHLDGKTPAHERKLILERLRSGKTAVVSNCGIVSEGFDLPALSCVIIARPTQSRALHMQMIGRVMRPEAGKSDAIVLDHAGNVGRHGFVTDEIEFSLTSRIKTSRESGERSPIICPECEVVIAVGTAVCPECGEVLREPLPEHVEGELVNVSEGVSFSTMLDAWNEIELKRKQSGQAEGWSYYQYKERFGDDPVYDLNRRLVNTKCATSEQKQSVFTQIERLGIRKGFKPGWISHTYKKAFGAWPRGMKHNQGASNV